jgi:hypothetical protein
MIGRYTRPYFSRRSRLKSPLSLDDARRRLEALTADGLQVRTDGDRFRLYRGGHLLDRYPRVAGEVSRLIDGSEVFISVGVSPLIFTLFAAVTALVLFWESAAILARVIASAFALPVAITWQPVVGGLVLAVAVALNVITIVKALRDGDGLVDRIADAVEANR